MKPLIRKLDCLRLYVTDLEAGLAFYRDRLGHELIWRSATAAGLRMPDTDAELVIQTEEQRQEIDLLVNSADEAAEFAKGSPILQGEGNTIEVRKIAKDDGVH